jgi:predicted amidohydrolase
MLIAAAQLNPLLGDLAANREAHLANLAQAEQAGAALLLFPELSLTGYALRDLVSQVALHPDDPFLEPLREASRRLLVAAGFVERDHQGRLHNSVAVWAEGRLLHVQRKLFLPTYGLFEEGRFFARGERLRAFDSPLGRLGLLICNDWWHAGGPLLLAQDGAGLFLAPAASPLRGLAPRPASAPGWMDSPGGENGRVWYSLLSAHAKMQSTPILFCNRCGFDDGVGFWGGSSFWSPAGMRQTGLDHADPALLAADWDPAATLRERAYSPLLRDETQALSILEAELASLRQRRSR